MVQAARSNLQSLLAHFQLGSQGLLNEVACRLRAKATTAGITETTSMRRRSHVGRGAH